MGLKIEKIEHQNECRKSHYIGRQCNTTSNYNFYMRRKMYPGIGVSNTPHCKKYTPGFCLETVWSQPDVSG